MSAIQAMITGYLTKDAEQKTSGSGKGYTAVVIRTAGEPVQFVRAAIWGDDAETVANLIKGDPVAVVGTLTVGIWESNGNASPSLFVTAHRAISPSNNKAKKTRQKHRTKPRQSSFRVAAEAQSIRPVASGELSDDIPWDR